MADINAFPRRLPVTCSAIAHEKVQEARELLNSLILRSQIACPACTGRGVMLYKNSQTGLLDPAPCPCGGTDEDRIDFDFGGAA